MCLSTRISPSLQRTSPPANPFGRVQRPQPHQLRQSGGEVYRSRGIWPDNRYEQVPACAATAAGREVHVLTHFANGCPVGIRYVRPFFPPRAGKDRVPRGPRFWPNGRVGFIALVFTIRKNVLAADLGNSFNNCAVKESAAVLVIAAEEN
jgi:hypothetical protein